MRTDGTRLLLVTHVAIRTQACGLQIDDQTAAGIAQWCKHFDEVTFYGVNEDDSGATRSSATWVHLPDDLKDRCTLNALPRAYGLLPMMRAYWDVRTRLRGEIAGHSHLSFTIGTLRGDWPSVAAIEAIVARRRYTAWIDRVETQVIRQRLSSVSGPLRVAATISLPIISLVFRFILRRSSVALLQGGDCYKAYSSLCKRPFCTYDTHTKVDDEIRVDQLAHKTSRVISGAPLNLLYVGRAAGMKGAQDWVNTLAHLDEAGVPFRATWVGDGPELAMMQKQVIESGLSDRIHLPGFEGDRQKLLSLMRSSDIFVFCHKTLESPRCLIESLVCGCPIVGYGSPYSKGLIEKYGGGVFVKRDDISGLAEELARLHKDRGSLAQLIKDSALSGKLYNEDEVYRYRAQAMLSASG